MRKQVERFVFFFKKWYSLNGETHDKKKLKVTDYVFSYKGEYLTHAYIEYNFGEASVIQFKDGKKDKEYTIPNINFELKAEDANNKEYSLSFMLKTSLESLNKLSKEPTNINELVIESEIFFINPYDDSSKVLFPYLTPTIYHPLAEFCAAKVEENTIHFKVFLPEDDIFLWFIIDFNS